MSISIRLGPLAVLQAVGTRGDRVSDGVDEGVHRRGAQRHGSGSRRAQPASSELVLDDPAGAVQPVAQARDGGGMRALDERTPERGAGEGGLDLLKQFVDRPLVLGLLGANLLHQPLKRVAQMPLAQIRLSLR
jgi:hypothetical protein